MNLANLPKITSRSAKRLGRGHGSGKVKTSGRGTKGQKAREDISLKYAGSSLQASWLKRLPLLRGKGKNKSLKNKPVALNFSALKNFKGKIVSLDTLKSAKIISKRVEAVKILGTGDIKTALTFKVPVSKSAQAAIEKAGGTIEA